MSTFSVKYEDYNSKVRSGDLVIRDITLAGWGAVTTSPASTSLRDFTDHGRLWGRITTGNVFELWKTPTFDVSTNRTCYTSSAITAAGIATFIEDNSSGISGTAYLSYTLGEEQLFDIIVSYADELDIARAYQGLSGELDSNGDYEGQDDRFESLLKEAKRRDIDPEVYNNYMESLGVDDLGRPLLAKISDPRQLAEAHAAFCVYRLYKKRRAQDIEFRDVANDSLKEAQKELADTPVAFDVDADGSIDNPTNDVTECERG